LLVQQARAAGAVGFLPKSVSAEDVMAAVRAALRGEPAFAAVPYGALPRAAASHASIAPWASSSGPQSGRPPGGVAVQANEAPLSLNGRQLDILRYLGRGTPNKAIARHMEMNEAEVRAEVSWLTESLGARSREEAYATAKAWGLVDAS
jgi:two-component system nitrate/nitrite response regulator NarL